MIISCMHPPLSEKDLQQLTELLYEAVSLGASLGFTDADRQREAMFQYWQQQQTALAQGKVQLFTARREDQILGVVGLERSEKDNGRHRGEVFKLIVSPQWRRQGIAKKLMAAVTKSAQQQGIKLVVLDTRSEDITVALYLSLGWHEAGQIPDYALSTTGEWQSTTLMYRRLPEDA